MPGLSKVSAALLGTVLLLFSLPAPAAEITSKLITASEKEVIRSYYGSRSGTAQTKTTSSGKKTKGQGKNKGQGGGQGKAANLPKGIAMKLQRGGAMPPGIEKTKLPSDLQGRLPKRPKNQELTVVDRQVVLIEKTTGLILDVLEVLGER